MRARNVLTLLGLAGLLAMAAAWGRSQQQPQTPATTAATVSYGRITMDDARHGYGQYGYGPRRTKPGGVGRHARHAAGPSHGRPAHAHDRASPGAAWRRERAEQIVSALRQTIEKYRDYRVALADGYRIFAAEPAAKPNTTSRITGMAFSKDLRSTRRGRLPCSTRKLPGRLGIDRRDVHRAADATRSIN